MTKSIATTNSISSDDAKTNLNAIKQVLDIALSGPADADGREMVTVSRPWSKAEVGKLNEAVSKGITALDHQQAGVLTVEDQRALHDVVKKSEDIKSVLCGIGAEHMFSHGRKGDVFDKGIPGVDASQLSSKVDEAYYKLGDTIPLLQSLSGRGGRGWSR